MNLQELDIIKLKLFPDSRGVLIPVEFEDLPFVPKRMFWVTHPAGVRGKHANLECQQFFYVFSGKVQVSLFDGIGKKTFELLPGQGLFIDRMIWNAYKPEADASLTNIYVVLASHPYDADDYITDRDEFVKLINEKAKR